MKKRDLWGEPKTLQEMKLNDGAFAQERARKGVGPLI